MKHVFSAIKLSEIIQWTSTNTSNNNTIKEEWSNKNYGKKYGIIV